MAITKELRERILALRAEHGPNRNSGAELTEQIWYLLDAVYKLELRVAALEGGPV